MKYCLKNAIVYTKDGFLKANVNISDGLIVSVDDSTLEGGRVFEFENLYIFPGFSDVHVHLREPGFSYKETMKTGTKACARGGYTNVCSMPNLKPVPDSFENLKKQLDIIEKDACINVYPFGAITVEEKGETLADMDAMAPYAIGFSDDGRGVQCEDMMLRAMEIAKKHDKIISAHCEDNSLLFGGYIHDGEYAKKNGHKGICSESEWGPIKRDVELVKRKGCKYHVCHMSAKESVEIIRNA
ncbi:MAG: amidohydrolase family protein, partial [Clostridia bacterium]|nr:amidohydrolase family protein [Clostridia bacterium]